jgi:hypothetical protein
MAIPPASSSSESWNPAVPPPPVAGAAAGVECRSRPGLADALADLVWLADGLAEGLAEGLLAVLLGAGLLLAEPLALALGEWLVLAESLPLAEPLPLPELLLPEPLLPEPLGPGENVGVDGEDPEQPAMAAEPRMARVAKLTAASLTRSPVTTLGLPMLKRSPHRRREFYQRRRTMAYSSLKH